MSFWDELGRRNVFKVAAAYAVLAWLLAQVASLIAPALRLPEWTVAFVIVILLLGFPIAVFLAWAYEITPSGISKTKAGPDAEQPGRPTTHGLNYVVIGLLAAAVIFLIVDNYWLDKDGPGRSSGPTTIQRIAVLPCDDLSPDTRNSYFAAGIHDELINRLVQVSSFRVTSRSSVEQFRDNRPAIPEIGAILGVDAIMECGARYSGDSVVLTAQLIDAATDEHIWSESFPADMSDLASVIELQAQVAVRIADAVRVDVLEEERAAIERLPTESRRAYELFLAGIDAPITERFPLLEQALEIDDRFVEAWISKANAHLSLASAMEGALREAEFAMASEAISRALAIAPDSPPVRGAYGFYLAQVGDWVSGEQEYRLALELGEPLSSMPAYAVLKLSVGRFGEALEILEANLQVAPLNGVAAGFLLAASEPSVSLDERHEQYERGEQLFGSWWGDHVELFMRLGDRDTEFLSSSPSNTFGQSTVIEVGASHLGDAQGGAASMRELFDNRGDMAPIELVRLGAWAAYYGDAELGLVAVRAAAELQASSVWYIWLPVFASARQELAFADLIADFELDEYWRAFGYPDDCELLAGTDLECF